MKRHIPLFEVIFTLKTKILKILSVYVAVIIAFSCFTLSTNALSPQYTFDFPISKPPVDEHSILMEILYSTDGGATVRAEIVYAVLPYEMYYSSNTPLIETSHINVTITKTNFTVSSGANNAGLGFRFTWFYMKDTGQMYFLRSEGSSFSQGLTQIIGVHVYGGALVGDSHGSLAAGSNFVFNYGSDALANNKLDVIIGLLRDYNSAGSDTAQPDFDSTNSALDSTTAEMQAVENEYKIDQTATSGELNKGSAFISSTDMQRASVQVKSWIEEFASDNKVISSFLVAALCLGLCFWVIGRKTSK